MKKSFTLIEIIISVLIFSVLILALSSVINNLKKTKNIIESVYKKQNSKELLIKTLYYDIINSSEFKIIKTKNSNIDRLYLKTSNSLYNLINPYVVWYISKKNRALIRIEYPFKIKFPLNKVFYIDKFEEGVKIFKVYEKKGKIFIFIKNKKPVYFEIVNKDYS